MKSAIVKSLIIMAVAAIAMPASAQDVKEKKPKTEQKGKSCCCENQSPKLDATTGATAQQTQKDKKNCCKSCDKCKKSKDKKQHKKNKKNAKKQKKA